MNGPSIFTENDFEEEPTRRKFLKRASLGVSALLLSGGGIYEYLSRLRSREYPGKIVGGASSAGHLLRDRKLSPPEFKETAGTVIIGGGIAGLSAAWWLKKHHYDDFKILELEANVGGNSQYGKNEISAFPWGAHYLPLPGPEAKLVKMLLEELEVIQGYDSKALPIFNELYLCADPHERLLIQGQWQEGLVPQVGITPADRKDYAEFFQLMEKLKTAQGLDGKRAFAIPMDFSSRDLEFMELDRVSMADFMKSKGWVSKKLHWYVNYCCRDDYGMGHDKVSAWAGIHYFASRIGVGANADSQTVLTWPEGNGWLVARLRDRLSEHISEQTVAYSVQNGRDGAAVDYFEVATQRRVRLHTKQVIFAAPRFVASHVIPDLQEERPAYLKDLQYAPWLVANVTLGSLPSGNGAPLSWDNVSFYSPSLGYIVATHQNLSLFPKQTVLTYYLPLDEKEPGAARKDAVRKTHRDWAKLIADDLEHFHNGIKDEIKNIDVWIWGHGMISPGIGFLWGESRRKMLESHGRIHFAHTDMSGISIFEEAQYRGVQAAEQVLLSLGHRKKRMG